jgi:hypothetical protein
MMKRQITRALAAVLLLCAAAAARAEEDPGTLWFPVGEELIYRLYWGVIPVGYSTATTKWIEEDGRKLISISFRSKSNDVLSKLWPVDDLHETVVDPVTFLPVRFTKRLSEGGYRADEVTVFDHERKVARWMSRKNGNRQDFAIESDTRDVISFMYFMRSKQIEPGSTSQYRVMADDKVYDLHVKAGKVEKFRVSDFGWIPCLELEPEAKFQGIFVRKGRMWLWVSRDSRRLLTKIAASLPIASVKVLLAEVRGPGDDLWTRTTRESKGQPSEKQE